MLDLANRAIARWPMTVSGIALAAHRENAVFRVDTRDQGTFALRVHRQDYRSDAELMSELAFMAALKKGGVSVPTPVQSRSGGLIEMVDGAQVSVLTWVGGRPLGQTGVPLQLQNRSAFFHQFGALIAQMHDISDLWQPPPTFTRQRWDQAGLLGETPQWGRFWDNPMLKPRERDLLQIARGKITRTLSAREWDVGFIHADLVSENILVEGGHVHVIDFDDSGFGYRLQDVATALVKHQQEPDYPELNASLMAGYRTRRPLDAESIDLFLLMRHLSYVGWIVPRMIGEDGKKRSAFLISDAIARASQWLSQEHQA
jgi:Ser/Thr protein kinase RdoA (MazF antagonist)